MDQYKYYLARDGAGAPLEIYRSHNVGVVDFFTTPHLWRAKKNCTWSNDPSETRWVYDRMMKGDFDPENNQITETEAMMLLDRWRAGTWPGRE